MFLSVLAAGILISLSATTANAQWVQSAKDQAFYAYNPCVNPQVSWVLWNEHQSQTTGIKPAGGPDCNIANYGRWSTAQELVTQLATYRYQQKAAANGIRYNGAFIGKDGNKYFVFSEGDAVLAVNIGRAVISNDGATLVSTNGGNVIAQGGGNLVPGATVIAQGGGNLISANSGKVIAQGGGNLVPGSQGSGTARINLALGNTLFQFPNRYVVVAGPPAPAPQPVRPATPPTPAPQPARPPTPPAPPVRTDDQVLLCTNSSSGVLAQIKRADSGANHITFYVTSGTAYFSGNVLTQSYKDQLANAARTCGARNVSNNLRIGK
jgi:hypothetical protein